MTKEKTPLAGLAPLHPNLNSELVHVFVDDQNLFWGIVNSVYGASYRIDFGRLLVETSKTLAGKVRGVGSAYIAGVIPDDDSFWKIAEDRGFTVNRGFLSNAGGRTRSKQDDSHLITNIVETACEQQPGTIILIAGDADYAPPLRSALRRGWRVEVGFIGRGVSSRLQPFAHSFRIINPSEIRYYKGFAL